MWKLTMKLIKGTKMKSFMIIFGIAMGVALMISVAILNHNLNQNMEEVLRSANGTSDMSISCNDGFSEEELEQIRAVEFVEELSPVTQYSFRNNNEKCDYETWLVVGIDSEKDAGFREYRVVEGKLFSDDTTQREAVISKRNAEMLGVGVGDSLMLQFPTGEAQYTVTGILEDIGAGFANLQCVVYAPIRVVQTDLQAAEYVNKIDLHITDSKTNYRAVYTAVNSMFGGEITVSNTAAEYQKKQDDIQSMKTGFNVLLIVVITLCVYMIYNTYSVTIQSRMELVGLFRTLGAEKRDARRLMFFESLIYGVIGTAIGMMLGLLLGLALLYGYGDYKELGLFRVPGLPVVLAAVLGVAISMVSGLIPTFKICKVKPIESLRGEVEEGKQGNWSWLNLVRRIIAVACFAVPIVMAIILGRSTRGSSAMVIMIVELSFFCTGFVLVLPEVFAAGVKLVYFIYRVFCRREATLVTRNMERSKARSIIVVATFIVAIMMSVGLNGMFNNFRKSVADYVDATNRFDISLSGELNEYGDKNTIYAMLDGIAGVKDFSGLGQATAKDASVGYSILLYGIYPEEYGKVGGFEFIDGDEEAIGMLQDASKQRCIVGSHTAEIYGVEKGDTLGIVLGGIQFEFEVLAVINSFEQSGRVLYLNNDILTQIVGKELTDCIYMTIEQGADVADVMNALKETFDAESTSIVSAVKIKENQVANIIKGTGIFDAIILCVFVIGVLVLMNILVMSTMERQKEFGMLRACGAQKSYIIKIVVLECVGYFLIGALFGIVCGMLFMYYGTVGMAGSMHLNVSMYLPYKEMGKVLLAVAIAAVPAVVGPTVVILRSSILDNIRANKFK